jgi:dolichyl-phosphate beta-glucosyltransferase
MRSSSAHTNTRDNEPAERRIPSADDGRRPTSAHIDVSVIVPAYNEVERLPHRLRAFRDFLALRPWRPEILVVDDGSADRTAEVAGAESTPTLKVRVVSLGVNQGKGAAVRRGVAEANPDAQYMAVVDADFPYAFGAFDVAMARLIDGAEMVIGGRDLVRGRGPVGRGAIRTLAASVYSVLVNRLAVRGIPDTQCGLKWFRAPSARALFEQVTLTSFAFDVELLVLAQRWGLRIDRIPVELTHSQGSTVRLLRHGPRMLWDLLKINRNLARGVYDRPR